MENQSRVNKLFNLLSNNNEVLRDQAAKQIGDVIRENLPNFDSIGQFLLKLRQILKDPNSWETRYAAAKAVDEICSAVSKHLTETDTRNQWSPPNFIHSDSTISSSWDLNLDLQAINESGLTLAASQGDEFSPNSADFGRKRSSSTFPDLSSADDPVVSQRSALNRHLNIHPALNLNTQEWISDEDLIMGSNNNSVVDISTAPKIAKFNEISPNYEDPISPESLEKQLSSTTFTFDSTTGGKMVDPNLHTADILWSFYRLLCFDLVDPCWTSRHGSALGLKVTCKYLAKRQAYLNKLFKSMSHVFAVVSLDSFNDFVGSHVVAPVRETCAQILATIFPDLPIDGKKSIILIINKFLRFRHYCDDNSSSSTSMTSSSACSEKTWQNLHTGLLFAKYILPFVWSVMETNNNGGDQCPSTFVDVLKNHLQSICRCIEFENEDVIITASEALAPNLTQIDKFFPNFTKSLSAGIWKTLQLNKYDPAVDEWAGGLLTIAAQLSTLHPEPYDAPRVALLLPFLNFNVSGLIFTAAVKCLTSAAAQHVKILDWSEQGVLRVLRALYVRRICCLNDDDQLIGRLWTTLLSNDQSPIDHVIPYFSHWLACLMLPDNYPAVDPILLGFGPNEEFCGCGGGGGGGQIFIAGGQSNLSTGSETTTDSSYTSVLKAKTNCAKLLAILALKIYQRQKIDRLSAMTSSPTSTAPPSSSDSDSLENCLLTHLNSNSITRKVAVLILLLEWVKSIDEEKICNLSIDTDCDQKSINGSAESCGEQLFPFDTFKICINRHLSCENDEVFDEILPLLTELNGQRRNLHNQVAAECDLSSLLSDNWDNRPILNSRDAKNFDREWSSQNREHELIAVLQNYAAVSSNINNSNKRCNKKSSVNSCIEKVRQFTKDLRSICERVSSHESRLFAYFSCLFVRYRSDLPEKLNFLISPLMQIVKEETTSRSNLIYEVSEALTLLLFKLATGKNRLPLNSVNPSGKLLKNLIYINSNQELKQLSNEDELSNENFRTIFNFDQRISSKSSLNSKNHSTTNFFGELPNFDTNSASFNASMVLKRLCEKSGSDLPQTFPSLWIVISLELKNADQSTDAIVVALKLLTTILENLHANLRRSILFAIKPGLCKLIGSRSIIIRYSTCCLICRIAKFEYEFFVNEMLIDLLTRLSSNTNSSSNTMIDNNDEEGCNNEEVGLNFESGGGFYSRLGSMEAVFALLEETPNLHIIGIGSLLALPVLARMSDSNVCIRQMASICFGSLVKILPLEFSTSTETKDPTISSIAFSQDIVDRLSEQRQFLTLLSKPENLVANLHLRVVVKSCDLRAYQKEGVAWLWFLKKYELHGILCDDMGLGKTLQTLCCLANSYAGRFLSSSSSSRDHQNSTNRSSHVTPAVVASPPSLVVCPKTLVQHWLNETCRFFIDKTLVAYSLDSSDKLLAKDSPLNATNSTAGVLCVVSYDFLRKESKFFSTRKWHYCILDEGHVIKNPKTLTTQAVMQLKSEHRLVLSGTPIQNNVLELWTLFEFLMPGYLGDRKLFYQKFGKLITGARDTKSTSAEFKLGQDALANLHKLVLPFVLRRRKADVLDELPPKIVQDIFCPLSALQSKLYKQFARTAAEQLLARVDDDQAPRRNALQILTYLRKLCDHPCLVLKSDDPDFPEIVSNLRTEYNCMELTDFSLSGKIVALRQLFLECGIGSSSDDEEEMDVTSSISPHRALIFCQFKSALDLLCAYFDRKSIFGRRLGYLRLDGTVPAGQRQFVVDQFNRDPSIDLLLLTTTVGGLGLNLTGADVVVFIDHDWNPAKDLQAMDRAHRIGQKRTVNVYRLITKDTLEEKIMHYQAFKSSTADAVISEQNRSLASMATDQLLDLLTDGQQQQQQQSSSKMTSCTFKRSGVKRSKVVDEVNSSGGELTTIGRRSAGTVFDLPSLWDQSQYEEAFDLQNFVNSVQNIG